MASPEVERPWLMLAVLSGACAACNGAFAKLTTTALTAAWARDVASLMSMPTSSTAIEYAIRIMFFVLNMTFNGVMWGLFTRALALSPSAIRVNVINTASNFLVTAVVGYLIFKEHLPPLWFVGAGMLVAGSVIIGGRDQGKRESDRLRGDDLAQSASADVPSKSDPDATQSPLKDGPRKRKPATGRVAQ